MALSAYSSRKKLQRLFLLPGLAEIVERADIAAGAKSALAIGGDDHPRHRVVVRPSVELASHSARTISWVMAFSAFGRLSVTIPAAPRRSNRMSIGQFESFTVNFPADRG